MMRKLLVGIIGLYLFTACTGETEATIGEYTSIEVDALYDAGTVAKGEKVNATIEVKNVGDYPLVLAEVKGSCSCTVSSFTKDPVAPGASTTINAVVDTDQTGKGMISKSVTIMANTRPAATQITIKANVID